MLHMLSNINAMTQWFVHGMTTLVQDHTVMVPQHPDEPKIKLMSNLNGSCSIAIQSYNWGGVSNNLYGIKGQCK